MDPELNVNIVDLGLVYKIQVTRIQGTSTKVKILMTLTTPGCPLAGMFEALVAHGFSDVPGFDPERDLKIELTFDPPWTPEMMSETAKAELGFE